MSLLCGRYFIFYGMDSTRGNRYITRMSVTEAIYYQQPYSKELDAHVVASAPWGKPAQNLFAVQLARTICYPEGGGQPGDRGNLHSLSDASRSCRIIDTRKGDDDAILHIVEGPFPFAIGDSVHMTLDWSHRYEYMQQHTAQHLISGLLYTRFGIGTVSVHQGEEILTVETDRGDIPVETLHEMESLVNQAIRSCAKVSYEERSHSDAEALGLRRSIKVEGSVRLVRIGDIDVIACGGIHVASTDEIGLVLFVGTEMIRGHVRTIWKTADRAVSEIHRNQAIVHELGTVFSAQPQNLVEKARQLQMQATDSQWHRQKIASRLAAMLLLVELEGSDRIVRETPVAVLDISSEPELSLKQFAEQLDSYEALALCVVQVADGKLSWMIGLKGPFAEAIPFNVFRSRLLPMVNGKGGGRPPLWQGVGTDVSDPQAFLREFRTLIEEQGRA